MAKLWRVWSEGYSATVDHAPAQLMGEVFADDFLAGCRIMASAGKWGSLYREDKEGRAYYWGCRLFDNEADARRSFG